MVRNPAAISRLRAMTDISGAGIFNIVMLMEAARPSASTRQRAAVVSAPQITAGTRKMKRAFAILLLTATAPAAWADGDPAKGEKAFRMCSACHSATDASNR